MMSAGCDHWIHNRCTGWRINSSIARFLFVKIVKEMLSVEQNEELHKGIKTVKRFCYLEDRSNASRGCETAVTKIMRNEWKRFRECGELLLGRRFLMRMKEKIHQS